MGVVHGATNLSGAILTIVANSIHDEKVKARFMTAIYYF